MCFVLNCHLSFSLANTRTQLHASVEFKIEHDEDQPKRVNVSVCAHISIVSVCISHTHRAFKVQMKCILLHMLVIVLKTDQWQLHHTQTLTKTGTHTHRFV